MVIYLKVRGSRMNMVMLSEDVVPQIDPSRIKWAGMYQGGTSVSQATLIDWLSRERIVIANVMKGHHFVLVVGWDNENKDTFYIHDPGFDRASYSYTQDFVGYRIFDMLK